MISTYNMPLRVHVTTVRNTAVRPSLQSESKAKKTRTKCAWESEEGNPSLFVLFCSHPFFSLYLSLFGHSEKWVFAEGASEWAGRSLLGRRRRGRKKAFDGGGGKRKRGGGGNGGIAEEMGRARSLARLVPERYRPPIQSLVPRTKDPFFAHASTT